MKEITKAQIVEAFRVLRLPIDKASIPVVTDHLMIWLGYWNAQNKKLAHKQIKSSVMTYVLTYNQG